MTTPEPMRLSLVKNAADVVDKLQDLHKKMADVEQQEQKVVNQTQNNVFMVVQQLNY